MKKKTFLVTGGTGFIGSEICKLLLKKNYNIIDINDKIHGQDKLKLANDNLYIEEFKESKFMENLLLNISFFLEGLLKLLQ